VNVPYRTLWGWINESEEFRQRYDEAREEKDQIIKARISAGFMKSSFISPNKKMKPIYH